MGSEIGMRGFNESGGKVGIGGGLVYALTMSFTSLRVRVQLELGDLQHARIH